MDERNADRTRDAAGKVAEATRESYRAAVDQAFDVQKGGMRLSRRFFENWIEALDRGAELNRRTAGHVGELLRQQQEMFRALSRESLDAYDGSFGSLSSHNKEVPEPKDQPGNGEGPSSA